MRKMALLIVVAIAFLPVYVEAQSPVKLSCSLGEEFIFVNIDETKSTVNGISASFTPDMITWLEIIPNTANISYYINRYTGDIKRQLIDHSHAPPGIFTYGRCQRVSEKQF